MHGTAVKEKNVYVSHIVHVCVSFFACIRKRKAYWIGRILRRNGLLQRVTEGKIQGG
jgi:hypothetical protein